MKINNLFGALLLGLLLLGLGCQKDTPIILPEPEAPQPPVPITYLALGDSYTIGHSVPVSARYPMQLADSLRAQGLSVAEVRIVAKTGWTTTDLQAGIQAADIGGNTYDIVTLLIGVNNQYRRQPLGEYRTTYRQLLLQAIGFAGGDASRVTVLSIPDYSVTTFGQNTGNPAQTSSEIDAFNAAKRSITDSLSVAYFDITPISREAAANTALTASDGLHPSGEMYRRWVQLIRPSVQARLP